MMKLVEQIFEKALWNFQFVVLLAVISSLITAFTMFIWRQWIHFLICVINGLRTDICFMLFCNHKVTQGSTRANGIKRIAGD